MTHIVLQKVHGILVPVGDESERFVAALRSGEGIGFDVKVQRNVLFHRKFYALLRLGFDAWEPIVPEDSVGIVKSFEKFREDILILAGHFESVYETDFSGSAPRSAGGQFVKREAAGQPLAVLSTKVTMRAKSINFERCDQLEFEALFRRVLTVMWEKVLRGARYESEADVDRVMHELLGFE
jgi:hypothetical protein